MDVVVEGFALSASTLHPEVLLPRRHAIGKDRPNGLRADHATTDFAVWRAWFTPIISVVAGLRSRILREREIRRIMAAWETIDDRTLKDIGISRYEIEYATYARHWS